MSRIFAGRLSRALMVASAVYVPQLAWTQEMPPFDCIIEPEMVIELSSAVDGVVRDVAVDRSDRVSAGQVLATLVSQVEEAEVALAQTRASLDEEIEAARVQNDLAQSKKARVLELFSKQSIPGFEKDEVIAEASLAALALKQATNNQKLAKMALVRAQADLELRSIKSPIDGVVMDRFVQPGESVNDRPLFKLAKIDPMRVEIIAYSEYFGRVTPGMQAEVFVEGPRETRHLAKVSIVDSVVDAASGTFGIRLSLPNPDDSVVGGLKCRAEFPRLN